MATDLLTDFEAYFTSQNLVGSWGVFKDTIMDNPDAAIAIYEYGGMSAPASVDGADRRIQIVTRDKNAASARAKAFAIFDSLKSDDCILNLTTDRWCLITLGQTPFKMKYDTHGRSYYCFNITVTTYLD